MVYLILILHRWKIRPLSFHHRSNNNTIYYDIYTHNSYCKKRIFHYSTIDIVTTWHSGEEQNYTWSCATYCAAYKEGPFELACIHSSSHLKRVPPPPHLYT